MKFLSLSDAIHHGLLEITKDVMPIQLEKNIITYIEDVFRENVSRVDCNEEYKVLLDILYQINGAKNVKRAL